MIPLKNDDFGASRSPAAELKVCITGLSRTRFETSSLSQRLLATTEGSQVRSATEEDGAAMGDDDDDDDVGGLPRPVMPAVVAALEPGRPLLATYVYIHAGD